MSRVCLAQPFCGRSIKDIRGRLKPYSLVLSRGTDGQTGNSSKVLGCRHATQQSAVVYIIDWCSTHFTAEKEMVSRGERIHCSFQHIFFAAMNALAQSVGFHDVRAQCFTGPLLLPPPYVVTSYSSSVESSNNRDKNPINKDRVCPGQKNLTFCTPVIEFYRVAQCLSGVLLECLGESIPLIVFDSAPNPSDAFLDRQRPAMRIVASF